MERIENNLVYFPSAVSLSQSHLHDDVPVTTEIFLLTHQILIKRDVKKMLIEDVLLMISRCNSTVVGQVSRFLLSHILLPFLPYNHKSTNKINEGIF